MHQNSVRERLEDERELLSPLIFQAHLLPHRSLSRKGLIALLSLIGVISFISGALFAQIGAWPVTGFVGLGALLIYAAFRLNNRDARLYERVDLNARELKVTRVHPSGRSESWCFNPYWVRLSFAWPENTAGQLSLSSHGQQLVFGAFLSGAEKESFAAALGKALSKAKLTPPHI